jgi:hypothetical protein
MVHDDDAGEIGLALEQLVQGFPMSADVDDGAPAGEFPDARFCAKGVLLLHAWLALLSKLLPGNRANVTFS